MGLLDDQKDPNQQKPADDDLWSDLLDSVTDEEPPEEKPAKTGGLLSKLGKRASKAQQSAKAKEKAPQQPGRKRDGKRTGRGLTRKQALILGVLAVIVVGIYLGLAIVVQRTLPGAPSPTVPADTTAMITTTLPIETPVDTPAPLPTATTAPSDDQPAAPPTPTETPTPAPPVATKFDNNIRINPDNIDMRLQRGTEYIRLGAFTAAMYDFEHVLSLDETRGEAYTGIGIANYRLGKWPESENAYLTAIALNESMPEPRLGLGMLYYLQGRYKEAAHSFDMAAEINPNYAEAEAWLAITSMKLKDVTEAQGAATRAISITQDSAIVYIARAWSKLAETPPNIDAAQGDLLYAQELDPYNFELLVFLAQFYTDYRPERLVEAEQLATYALNWSKGNMERARSLHTLGHVYLAQNRIDDAKRVLGEAADMTTVEGYIVLAGLAEDLERAYNP